MAVDLGSTFKELIDEINSKSVIDSIDGLKGGTLSSPLTFTGGDQATAAKIALNRAGKGQITDENTRTLFGFISADTLTVGTDYYGTNIRGNANSIIGGKKFSDLAVKSDIPSTTNLVTTNTAQTISGIKTFNAPTDVSGKETITTKLKTSNGGALIIGKEGQNSGTMLRFDQVDGTCRLRFRSSATAGSMVWEQPEKNAALYFDMGNSTGSGKNRVTLRNVAGTLALTKEIPAAVSANPTLSGSETELTGLQIGSTKYKIPSGGSGGGGSGGCTLDDLEAEYKESIANEDIDNVNGIPVLDVENTGYWIMVPVSELGGGGGEKKYYNHYVKITEPGTYGSGKKEIILNIVSTSNAAFTKNNIYLHLKQYQLCICNFTEYPSLTVKVYSAYIISVTTSQLTVGLIGGDTLSPLLSDITLTDSVTLISDL